MDNILDKSLGQTICNLFKIEEARAAVPHNAEDKVFKYCVLFPSASNQRLYKSLKAFAALAPTPPKILDIVFKYCVLFPSASNQRSYKSLKALGALAPAPLKILDIFLNQCFISCSFACSGGTDEGFSGCCAVLWHDKHEDFLLSIGPLSLPKYPKEFFTTSATF
uniref:Uncharacterized protein n=1 Tax=Glossina austeni TaxID=7395 RepID=A0A1A9VJR7_GLOAU